MTKATQVRLLVILVSALISPITLADTTPTSDLDKLSYSLGVKTAENFNDQEIKINSQQYVRGLNDAWQKRTLRMTKPEMQTVLNKFQQEQVAKITAREKKMVSDNMAKSTAFLADNKAKPGVVTLPSGLQYIELVPGKGAAPKAGDTVTVNYRGTLLDGTEFDSSYSRNQSSKFSLQNLIPGWQEALLLMKPGAKWKIFIPPQLAYGDKGAGQTIEPNSMLIFEIELVDVKPQS